MATTLDEILKKYTTGDGDTLRGAAFIVKDKNGRRPPFTPDTVGWSASMSKLVTSVAAMQLVDRGLIGLDDDAGKHVPYLADVKLLTGFDDNGTAILEKPTKPVTLRHLLTHTSGFVYGALSPLLAQWGRSTGSNPGDDHTLDAISVPLVFSPGSSWMYGKSVDWAGRVVEGISGLSLEKYMKRNFFAPLGMDSTTFFMATRPDLQARRAEVDVHEVPGHPLSSTGPPRLEDPEIAVGGSGLFGSPSDYAKLLGALISGDSRILSPETFKIMITPQLEDTSIMQGMCETPIVSPMPDTTGPDYPHPVLMNHTLCGAVNMEGVPNHRKKGSVAWSGLTNGHWWIDPESGIAATVYVQVAPFGTPVAVNLRNELETEAYKLWGRK